MENLHSPRAFSFASIPASPWLAPQWSAVSEAASVIAILAAVDERASTADHLAFPLGLRRAPERRKPLIEQAMDDLIAMLELGLAALLTVHEAGTDARPAAMALWQEFIAARQGLLALADGYGNA
jgi:hypothetical protein